MAAVGSAAQIHILVCLAVDRLLRHLSVVALLLLPLVEVVTHILQRPAPHRQCKVWQRTHHQTVELADEGR